MFNMLFFQSLPGRLEPLEPLLYYIKLVISDGGKPVLLYNNGSCNNPLPKSVSSITDDNSYTISK